MALRNVFRYLAGAAAGAFGMLALLDGLMVGAHAAYLSIVACLYVRARAHGVPPLK